MTTEKKGRRTRVGGTDYVVHLDRPGYPEVMKHNPKLKFCVCDDCAMRTAAAHVDACAFDEGGQPRWTIQCATRT